MAVFPSDSIRTKNWGTEILTDADLEAQLDLLHAYFTAALHSSTGHTHDGTSNQGPKLAFGGVATTFGSGFTTVTAASGDYVLVASDVSDSNTTKKALVSDIITASTFTPSVTNALSGSVIQVVNTQTGATSTTTTIMPCDDTIPQNTEGGEFMTRAITPNNSSNKLKIEVVVFGGEASDIADAMAVGLFQDSTAGALAAGMSKGPTGASLFSDCVVFTHYMTAGTTSSTTFKVRAGLNAAGTFTFNGASGRLLGGVIASSITITEIKA